MRRLWRAFVVWRLLFAARQTFLTKLSYSRLVQLESEHLITNQEVAGSSPASAANFYHLKMRKNGGMFRLKFRRERAFWGRGTGFHPFTCPAVFPSQKSSRILKNSIAIIFNL